MTKPRMNFSQSEIIQMAREAGFHTRHNEPNEWWGYTDAFTRFAYLIAERTAKDEKEVQDIIKETDSQQSIPKKSIETIAFEAAYFSAPNFKLEKQEQRHIKPSYEELENIADNLFELCSKQAIKISQLEKKDEHS